MLNISKKSTSGGIPKGKSVDLRGMSHTFRLFLQVVLLISGTAICTSTSAQQDRFVFIQSENSQPFYVRIGETVYNSSPVGHVTIHGLSDDTYRFAIGFPHRGGREQIFTVKVNKRDGGYYLKSSQSGRWILYNWLTEETLQSPRTDSLLYGERKKDDGFASLMAAVVNDSAVLYTSVVKADPPASSPKKTATKSDTTASIVRNGVATADSALAKDDQIVTIQQEAKDPAIALVQSKNEAVGKVLSEKPDKEDSLVLHEVVATKRPVDTLKTIAKLEEQTSREEKRLVFLDRTAGIQSDTIVAIIPLEQGVADERLSDVAATEAPAADTVQRKKNAIKMLDSTISVVPGKPESDAMATNAAKMEVSEKDALADIDSAMAVVPEKHTGDSSLETDSVWAKAPDKPAKDSIVASDAAIAAVSEKHLRDSAQMVEETLVKTEKPVKETTPASDAAMTVIAEKQTSDSSLDAETALGKTPDKPAKDSSTIKETKPAAVPAEPEVLVQNEASKADSAIANAAPKAAMPRPVSSDTLSMTDAGAGAEKKQDSGNWSWQSQPRTGGLELVNSDCVKFATEHDLDKLRVKMLAQKDYNNRIFTAQKVFKSMCFTVKQIKALSELFPDDELRFRFYETAWPFVSDSSNFKTLEETLTDPFFIARFRALLKR